MSEGIHRKLAAIVAADVVGYSRLMGEDEAGTLAALRQWRAELFEPAIISNRGKVVKNMGDGWLVEFDSAGDAVTCAIQVQEQLSDHEILKLRIGLHIGDISHADDDIYGDGVNIAARLQEVAEPGAIVISDVTRRSIDGKLATAFSDLGRQELKNIAEPIAAFGWGMTTVRVAAMPLPLPEKPSIAVLPFENMSVEPEQEFFADGMTEDLITNLSKISSMFVIARNSSFAYKGQHPDVRDVASQLGVRYVLEGSVRILGSRMRITAQLIDGQSGSHLWAERYDRDVKELFDLQDEITSEIATALQVQLIEGQQARWRQNQTTNIDTWENYQRALTHLRRFNHGDNELARDLLNETLAKEPDFVAAMALLAWCYLMDARLAWSKSADASLAKGAEIAERAQTINGEDPDVWSMLGGLWML